MPNNEKFGRISLDMRTDKALQEALRELESIEAYFPCTEALRIASQAIGRVLMERELERVQWAALAAAGKRAADSLKAVGEAAGTIKGLNMGPELERMQQQSRIWRKGQRPITSPLTTVPPLSISAESTAATLSQLRNDADIDDKEQ